MKYLIKRAVGGALVVAFLLMSLDARSPITGLVVVAMAQETDDPVKIEVYTRFVNNRKTNETAAYQAATEYLKRYPKDKDQYTQYLQNWIVVYERDERKRTLPQLVYNAKNFAGAYSVGKQILADEPNYLPALIHLGYAGYLAVTTAKNETFNADAQAYANKAIQAIEAGKSPGSWLPFKDKDDTLAQLYYTVGFLSLKSAPDRAISPLIKAAQFETDLKKSPSIYYYIATAYESGPYKTMAASFQASFAGKEETAQSKLALEKLNVVIDLIIDVYARSVAAAGNDPANAQSKTLSSNKLAEFYKFRHQGSDAGMSDLITGVLAKPLPPKPQ
ncbi:MAG: hypothetical protein ND895_23465 [Pyrinomonadaceae bacterium]|nr:hypothetical protein [Pyrinomonadaceae bacterium]